MLFSTSVLLFLSGLPAVSSFAGVVPLRPLKFTSTTSRSAATTAAVNDSPSVKTAPAAPANDFSSKVLSLYEAAPKSTQYDIMIKLLFPGALNNEALETRVTYQLGKKGYTPQNTLLATSLCCDELARQLEADFVKVYGKNFHLGGLAGFPFAGTTGFGAMAAHIPDDGSVLIVYGPHVGVATTGGVGKVERAGIALVDNCCGSAIAASNYLKGICETGLPPTTNIQQFTDFQQVSTVNEIVSLARCSFCIVRLMPCWSMWVRYE